MVGVFCGDPLEYYVHWNGENYARCAGKEICEYCGAGNRPSMRILMNFYSGKKMILLEQGSRFFKDVIKCDEKYGLTKYSFEIERHGNSGDPQTTYSILPERELSKEELKEIADTPLHNLAEFSQPKPPAGDAGQLIDEKTANIIISVLKNLPKEAVTEFTAKFGITRVKELKQTSISEATAFLETLETKHKPKAAEVDPLQ